MSIIVDIDSMSHNISFQTLYNNINIKTYHLNDARSFCIIALTSAGLIRILDLRDLLSTTPFQMDQDNSRIVSMPNLS